MINRSHAARILIVFSVLFFSCPMFAWAKEFSADIVMDMQRGSFSGKVYFKNHDMIRNDVNQMINIINRPKVYQLFTKTKKYHVSNVDEMEKKNPLAGAEDFKAWAAQQKMKKVGQEAIEGFDCDIYEGDVTYDQAAGKTLHMKFWLSKKLNYPLKTENTMPGPMGKMTSRLENIKLGRLNDSLFEIPDDYTEAASMSEAMGMPDMGKFMKSRGENKGEMPSEGSTPSKEQMQEMMKKMQEMMKQQNQN